MAQGLSEGTVLPSTTVSHRKFPLETMPSPFYPLSYAFQAFKCTVIRDGIELLCPWGITLSSALVFRVMLPLEFVLCLPGIPDGDV